MRHPFALVRAGRSGPVTWRRGHDQGHENPGRTPIRVHGGRAARPPVRNRRPCGRTTPNPGARSRTTRQAEPGNAADTGPLHSRRKWSGPTATPSEPDVPGRNTAPGRDAPSPPTRPTPFPASGNRAVSESDPTRWLPFPEFPKEPPVVLTCSRPPFHTVSRAPPRAQRSLGQVTQYARHPMEAGIPLSRRAPDGHPKRPHPSPVRRFRAEFPARTPPRVLHRSAPRGFQTGHRRFGKVSGAAAGTSDFSRSWFLFS